MGGWSQKPENRGKPGTDHGFIRRKPWSVPGFAAGFVAVALGLAGMMAKGFHWL
jgi:hypothetical protein